MHIKIKRIDNTLPLPEYQTTGSVAFDIYTRETRVIAPHDYAMLPTNLIIATPPGYMLMLCARSSSAKKKGLTMRNGVGIIDQDYCGEHDELRILVQNLTENQVTVERGERLAQGVFIPIARAEWHEVDAMGSTSRGGFGSTG